MGPSVKGQRWALWGRAAQFPAEDRAQSWGGQAGGGGNPAKGAPGPLTLWGQDDHSRVARI